MHKQFDPHSQSLRKEGTELINPTFLMGHDAIQVLKQDVLKYGSSLEDSKKRLVYEMIKDMVEKAPFISFTQEEVILLIKLNCMFLQESEQTVLPFLPFQGPFQGKYVPYSDDNRNTYFAYDQDERIAILTEIVRSFEPVSSYDEEEEEEEMDTEVPPYRLLEVSTAPSDTISRFRSVEELIEATLVWQVTVFYNKTRKILNELYQQDAEEMRSFLERGRRKGTHKFFTQMFYKIDLDWGGQLPTHEQLASLSKFEIHALSSKPSRAIRYETLQTNFWNLRMAGVSGLTVRNFTSNANTGVLIKATAVSGGESSYYLIKPRIIIKQKVEEIKALGRSVDKTRGMTKTFDGEVYKTGEPQTLLGYVTMKYEGRYTGGGQNNQTGDVGKFIDLATKYINQGYPENFYVMVDGFNTEVRDKKHQAWELSIASSRLQNRIIIMKYV